MLSVFPYSYSNTSGSLGERVFPQLSRVLPNFHECRTENHERKPHENRMVNGIFLKKFFCLTSLGFLWFECSFSLLSKLRSFFHSIIIVSITNSIATSALLDPFKTSPHPTHTHTNEWTLLWKYCFPNVSQLARAGSICCCSKKQKMRLIKKKSFGSTTTVAFGANVETFWETQFPQNVLYLQRSLWLLRTVVQAHHKLHKRTVDFFYNGGFFYIFMTWLFTNFAI